MNEKSWVHDLVPRLEKELRGMESSEVAITIKDGKKLAYSCVIHEYGQDGANEPVPSRFETDLLICDTFPDGRWIPRVVVECKIGGSITTHDALTYSSKAAAHKQVHPYLRYGFLASEREHYAIPGRLVKHGAYFDFMVAWCSVKETKAERKEFCALLIEEIKASRMLQKLLQTTRQPFRTKYHILHRPLVLK